MGRGVSADQPNGDSGLPRRSLRSLLAMTRDSGIW